MPLNPSSFANWFYFPSLTFKHLTYPTFKAQLPLRGIAIDTICYIHCVSDFRNAAAFNYTEVESMSSTVSVDICDRL